MKEKRGVLGLLKVGFAGFAMGVANVIPGVSGGTMAFILGVFEELIDSVRVIVSRQTLTRLLHGRFREAAEAAHWKFLLALGIGILIAFAGVARLFVRLLDEYPEPTFSFFLGLIAASIYTIGRKVRRWTVPGWVALAAGAVVAYLLINLVPVGTPNVWYISFLCGIICICAMILPGISGSFLLLVLGQYQYVWGAIGDFAAGKFSLGNFNTILFLGLGAAIGIGGFSHFLSWLFKKHHDLTVMSLIGFMVGSLPRLWPWQETVKWSAKLGDKIFEVDATGAAVYRGLGAKITPLVVRLTAPENFGWPFWTAVGLVLLGAAIVLATEKLAERKN